MSPPPLSSEPMYAFADHWECPESHMLFDLPDICRLGIDPALTLLHAGID